MASLLGFVKGRSKSCHLNQLVRRGAAYCIAGRIHWHLRHAPSKDNVSDAPSWWHDPHKFKNREGSCKGISPDSRHDGKSKPLDFRQDIIIGSDPLKVEETELDDRSGEVHFTLPRGLVSYLPLFFRELFSGTGRLTTSIASWGLATLDPFEIYDGWDGNLISPVPQPKPYYYSWFRLGWFGISMPGFLAQFGLGLAII